MQYLIWQERKGRGRAAAKDKQHVFGPRSLMDTVCKTRAELLDQLARAVESLGRAKLSLEAGPDDEAASAQTQAIRGQIEGLRTECGTIRRELAWHRMSHGC